MQPKDFADAMAAIQVVTESYRDLGIDISDRIDKWLEKAVGIKVSGRKLARIPEVTDEVAIALATAMWGAFERERETLKVDDSVIKAYKFLDGVKMSSIAWRMLARDVDPSDRGMLVGPDVSDAARDRLFAIAGVDGVCDRAA